MSGDADDEELDERVQTADDQENKTVLNKERRVQNVANRACTSMVRPKGRDVLDCAFDALIRAWRYERSDD